MSRELVKRAKIEHKYKKDTVPPVLEPPPSPIKIAKLKIKRQSARKGLDLGHAGGAMCQFWGLGTVDLVSTKNRKFRFPEPKKSIKFIKITA